MIVSTVMLQNLIKEKMRIDDRKKPGIMNQSENRRYLIEELLKEQPRYAHMQIPADAEGEKQAAILKAEAQKEATIREAEGKAEAIMKVQQANADGIRFLKEAGADEAVLTMKSLEAFAKAADGKATKIIIPSEIQSIAGLVKSISEIAAKEDTK